MNHRISYGMLFLTPNALNGNAPQYILTLQITIETFTTTTPLFEGSIRMRNSYQFMLYMCELLVLEFITSISFSGNRERINTGYGWIASFSCDNRPCNELMYLLVWISHIIFSLMPQGNECVHELQLKGPNKYMKNYQTSNEWISLLSHQIITTKQHSLKIWWG